MNSSNLTYDFNPSASPRQERLLEAMSLIRLTFAELGRRLDISSVAARRLCLADTVPPQRRDQMETVFEEYGIDVDLLPPGVYTPPGPRRSQQVESVAD